MNVPVKDLGVENCHVMHVGAFDLLGAIIIIIVDGAHKNLDYVNIQHLICGH